MRDLGIHAYFYGKVDGALVAMHLTPAGVCTTLGVPVSVPAEVITYRKVTSALRVLNVRTNLNVITASTVRRLRDVGSETLPDLIARNPWDAEVKDVKAALRYVKQAQG